MVMRQPVMRITIPVGPASWVKGVGHSLGADLNGAGSLEGNFTDEHNCSVGWVAELLDGNSREQALMELSKKREQVPELVWLRD